MRLPHFEGIHLVAPLFMSIFTMKNIAAITLFPFVLYRNKHIMSNEITKTHETIHILQQTECIITGSILSVLLFVITGSWIVFLLPIFLFYILYLFFFLINLYRFPGRAYDSIPFEREAYRNSNRWVYLGLRKQFAWIKYI